MNWDSIQDIINLEAIDKVGSSFLNAKPFPFAVIDNFFKDNIALELEKEFPEFDESVWHEYNNPWKSRKLAMIGINLNRQLIIYSDF